MTPKNTDEMFRLRSYLSENVRWQDKDFDKGEGKKDIGKWSGGVAPADKWYWCRTWNTAMQGHKTNDKIKVRWQSKDDKRKIRDMGYGWCRTRHNYHAGYTGYLTYTSSSISLVFRGSTVSPLRSLYRCHSGSKRWWRCMDTKPDTLKLLFSRDAPGGECDMTINERRQSKIREWD